MITFATDWGRFNYRVAGVMIRDEHVLLQRFEGASFWVLPGGRVEMGEPAGVALARELEEELGVRIEVGRLLWTVENFFTYERTRFHELCNYFEVDAQALAHFDLDREHERREVTGSPIYFRWFRLDTLADVRLLPSFLQHRLPRLPASTESIVHYDEPAG